MNRKEVFLKIQGVMWNSWINLDKFELEYWIMIVSKRVILLFCLMSLGQSIFSQDLKGIVTDFSTGKGIEGVKVLVVEDNMIVFTDKFGKFSMKAFNANENITLKLDKPGYKILEHNINARETSGQELEFFLILVNAPKIEIPTIQLDEGDGDDDQDSEVYSLLTSSRDPILQAAAFQFSPFRFKLKSIDQIYNQVGFNGFLLTDLENGNNPFYLFSGQNQITRYSENDLSYPIQENDFGSLGINQWINFDPASYRKGFTANYSLSNRSYTHRLALQYVNHLPGKGLHYILGANRRWAQEANIPGTFYDAWGVYAGISKKFKSNSGLSLFYVQAPVVRGKNSPGVKEVYDLSGDPLYNSYWGYQNGEKRNARMASTNIPAIFLNFHSNPNNRVSFTSGIMLVKGKRSDSNLDWNDAYDPRPDYYQKLPSFIEYAPTKDTISSLWQTDESVRQINWTRMHQVNRSNINTVYNINGGSDSITGRQSQYIQFDRHSDPTDLEHFLQLKYSLGKIKLTSAYRIEYTIKENYLELLDLLGGDFYVDKETFIDDVSKSDPDVNLKNKIIKVGDKLSYDYSSVLQRYSSFTQAVYKRKKFDFSAGFLVAHKRDFREGRFQNAIFENAKGKSETLTGFQWAVKTNSTYKINGRNYVSMSLAYESLPPLFDQVFINPGWRADVIPDIQNTTNRSGEIRYYFKSPGFKFQLGGFAIQSKNQTRNKDFFLDGDLETGNNPELRDGGLINGFYTGLNQDHLGVDVGVEYALPFGFVLGGMFQNNLAVYTSRPDFLIYDQFSKAASKYTIYLKNFFVPGTPQTVGTLNLKYNFKRFGFATLNFSYVDRSYLEVNPLRRTSEATQGIDRNTDLFRSYIDQEKLPAYFVMDAFIFKSYKIYGHYTSISLGVNNLLNNKNLVSGGFEQFRFDFESNNPQKFPNKYFNLQGINYFFNLIVSFE
ncbi:MAG: TonB-dependent receptor [Saprospiraceae bacterium]|nr:TonB-dependent receptor [Saprospiraceae bacterium]